MPDASIPVRHAVWAVTVAAIALLPRVLTALDDSITADEPLWTARSEGFSKALLDIDPSHASAARGASGTVTMPGVTTMWIGTVARGIWAAGRAVGIWPEADGRVATSALFLDIAQVVAAVVTSVLVGLIVVLVARWAGTIAAVTTGVILATEPFFVAHGAVLHTDELSTFLGVAFLLATALLLGLPKPTNWAGHRNTALLSGALFGAAWLTKVSALMFLPCAALLMVAAIYRRGVPLHRRSSWRQLRPELTMVGWGVVASAAIALLAYPALWANPFEELGNIARSAGQGIRDHDQFYFGEPTSTPGPTFYLVALPLRTTPWFLIGGAISMIGLVASRTRRPYLAPILCMSVPPLLILSAASKQFDRYGLPLLVVASIAVGIVVSSIVQAVRGHTGNSRWLGRAVTSITIAGTLIYATGVAPAGLAYFNPALGGTSRARDTVLIGWGEELIQASAVIATHSDNCQDATVWIPWWARQQVEFWPCGVFVGDPHRADYVVIYVNEEQRRTGTEITRLTDGRELIDHHVYNGVTYAETYAWPQSQGIAQN